MHPETIFWSLIKDHRLQVLCYGPTRLFKPPDALAMHTFGHRQGSATMHQWFRDLSITLTNLYMPVNQPCWLTIDNA